MRKNKYIIPSIEITDIDDEELLAGSPNLSSLSGGGNDGGSGTTESKRNVFFAINDPDGYEGKWGDIWSDETEEY